MVDADEKRVMTQPEKMDYIISGALTYFGIDKSLLTEKRGSRSPIWEVKKYITVLLYDYTTASYWTIARELGYKSHRNVIYHYNNIKEELSEQVYGSAKTKLIYKELLSYLNLNNYENKKGD